MTKLQWKMLVIGLIFLVAVILLYPTFAWYRLTLAERSQRELARDPLINKVLKLGLDLRGGSHLVLELVTDKLGGKTEKERRTAVTEAADQVIEVIRNRIDDIGVVEPLIARQGEKWIVVQLPGVKDPERAKEIIGKTALLEFRIVDDSPAMENIVSALRERSISLSSAIAKHDELPEDVLSLYPTGYVLMMGRVDRYYLVQAEPEMTGSSLVDAKVQMGGGSGFGYPEVSIEFNEEGAKKFARLTETHINRNLAIVLDGVVQSAPVIRTRIPDGRAVIEGNFTTDDAKLLKTVLRAGALPAPVKVIEERTVGPTLGEDSIRAGVWSCFIGIMLVILFMGFYYKGAGLVTDSALIFNLILLLSAMAYFQATLTLPGIGGIILTLGMAVDANVLILERIREELRMGKTLRMAVDQGYGKAFRTIIDSNVTTLIAALFLFQFGTGPVKGFAVTLTIGITISMFTAIFVTRVYYDWRLQDKSLTVLSI